MRAMRWALALTTRGQRTVSNSEHRDLAGLETERTRLHGQLASAGDFRPGSRGSTSRRCGEGCCAWSDPDHPGHLPISLLTKSADGKIVTRPVPDRPTVARVQQGWPATRSSRRW